MILDPLASSGGKIEPFLGILPESDQLVRPVFRIVVRKNDSRLFIGNGFKDSGCWPDENRDSVGKRFGDHIGQAVAVSVLGDDPGKEKEIGLLEIGFHFRAG